MTRTIVILGAGIGGFPVAHYLVRHTASKSSDVRVVLVSPTDEFYWVFAIPRAVIPGQMSSDDVSFSIPDSFAQYPASKFELVLGKADRLLPELNTVVVALNDGSKRNIEYHSIIVATGADDKHKLPWKNLGTSEETRDALDQLRMSIGDAQTIVVAGAGPTGVEFVGELGSEYSKHGTKKVILVSSDKLPLDSSVLDSVRYAAKSQLEKLNVKIIANTKVTATTGTGMDQVLELTAADGKKQSLRADLLIPAHGLTYNTGFMPAEMLDKDGRVKQEKTLQALGYKNVFAMGDAGNIQDPLAFFANGHVWHLGRNFERYMETGSMPEHKINGKTLLGLTLGRDHGTGQFGNWKIWGTLIWYLKGRHMGLDRSAPYMEGTGNADGKWN
ncbi:hypothetical protein B0J13DRAFT_598716 [Dactylonectria estremocensis]|uniref:FAD/NAD(P)-binding domain-containing protein n=1 Tax=Dactylonectria estremocensis TaxID=1079267 RepID=A0A9P9IMK8_9HYPO|nr:hypothetical protein B0J13DRAFT_598716 [Dactylonectria estremocensis]